MLNTYTNRKAAFIVPAGTIKKTVEKEENRKTRETIMSMVKKSNSGSKWSFKAINK